tara:strand:+ start:114 stop:773 length:660 start_codon:yes stop_codon:yes gene_type:complete
MSSPKYFTYFPNIQYALSTNSAGKLNRIEIKDYFHLLEVRDDIYREETLYAPYNIANGERPDQISYKFYGDEQYYWVILQINGIIDYYNMWPLSEPELEEHVIRKYGSQEAAGEIKQYETMKTFDQSDPPNLVLDGGLVVGKNFKYEYPSTPGSNVYLTSLPTSISFYTYERRLNDAKSQIYILDKKYIYDYVREVRNYGKNLSPEASYSSAGVVNPTY